MKGAANMKNLLKVAGITIALTAIGVAMRANRKDDNFIPSKKNKISGANVESGSNGIRTSNNKHLIKDASINNATIKD